jgi:hypothetical protein
LFYASIVLGVLSSFATRMVWLCDGNGLYSFGTVGLYFRFVMTNGAPVLDALDTSTERSPEPIMYLASVRPASPLTLSPGPTPSHVYLFYVLCFSCTQRLYRMCICTGIVNYVCSYREHCYWLEVAGRSTPRACTVNGMVKSVLVGQFLINQPDGEKGPVVD